MKSKSLYLLALGAFISSAYAESNYLTLENSVEGLTWDTATWSLGALPTATDTAIINIGDATNPLLVSGTASAGRIELQNNTYMLLSGEGVSLSTLGTSNPYGDFALSDNAKLVVSDGASLTLASNMSLALNGNSSAEFNNATFTGSINNNINSLKLTNSTWNLTGMNSINNTNIVVDNSNMLSKADIKMGVGQTGTNSKVFTLQNGTVWDLNGKGFNATGIVNVLSGSSIKNTEHFNIGSDGTPNGLSKFVVKGELADDGETKIISSLKVNKLWINVNQNSEAIMSMEGYSDVYFSSDQNTSFSHTAGNITIQFSGDSNTFSINSFSSWGNNRGNGNATSGNYLITTATTDEEGNETYATNTSMTVRNYFVLTGSNAANSSIRAGIDWAGATNVWNSGNNFAMDGDNATSIENTALRFVNVRNGAEMNLKNFYAGSEKTEENISGTNKLTVTDAGTVFTASSINLRNSGVEDSRSENYVYFGDGATVKPGAINIASENFNYVGGISTVEFSGSDTTISHGVINIGKADSTGGEAILKVSNGYTLTMNNNIVFGANDTTSGLTAGIIVDNAKLLGNYNMGKGYALDSETSAKFVTLQNGSTWTMTSGALGVAGDVNVLDSSSISGVQYLNIGVESGASVGHNHLYLRGEEGFDGEEDKIAFVSASSLWINGKTGSDVRITQDGYSNITINGNIDNNTNAQGSSNALWEINGNKNSFRANDARWGYDSSDNGEVASGKWLLTTAQKDADGFESFAENTNFSVNSITLRAADVADSTFVTEVDWAGATNLFEVRNNLSIQQSKGTSKDTGSILTIRDGAEATVAGTLFVGHGDMTSGYAKLSIENDATVSTNNELRITNSKVEGAKTTSHVIVDNANLKVGQILIGYDQDNQRNAVAGEAILELKNGTKLEHDGNIKFGVSNRTAEEGSTLNYTNSAKLIIDSSELTIGGEVYMAHSETIKGGDTAIILKGENAKFTSTNKTLYSGYNAVIEGGSRLFEITGKNNSMSWGSDNSFGMSRAHNGATTQTGGSFDITMTGEGHTFTSRDMYIGATTSTGGSNKFYSISTNADNKNKVILSNGGYTLQINASNELDATIDNSFELAGNTILIRDNGENVNVQVGNHAMQGGSASFIVSGTGNVVNGWEARIGNDSAAGGKALLQIVGSGNTINFNSFLSVKGDETTSEISFVADANGISTINVGYVDSMQGLLSIDFSKYVANEKGIREFELIASNGSLNCDNYVTSVNTELVDVTLADVRDSWEILTKGNKLVLSYNSYIPEPSTYAMIFGALALAFVAYRRRK